MCRLFWQGRRGRKERSDGIAIAALLRRSRHTQSRGFYAALRERIAKKKQPADVQTVLAGETRFEHATYGFGDRYSTVEPLPCVQGIL